MLPRRSTSRRGSTGGCSALAGDVPDAERAAAVLEPAGLEQPGFRQPGLEALVGPRPLPDVDEPVGVVIGEPAERRRAREHVDAKAGEGASPVEAVVPPVA